MPTDTINDAIQHIKRFFFQSGVVDPMKSASLVNDIILFHYNMQNRVGEISFEIGSKTDMLPL
jgi:hypothetical protein